MRTFTSIFLLIALNQPVFAARQEPSGTAPATTPARPPAQDSGSSSSKAGKKNSLPGYLITGTVFDDKALAFPGVRLRIRKIDEKKFRWETYTNSRGEFAVRVPGGQEYEVVVQAKNFQERSRKVSAGYGTLQEALSIKLQPATKEKTGAKP